MRDTTTARLIAFIQSGGMLYGGIDPAPKPANDIPPQADNPPADPPPLKIEEPAKRKAYAADDLALLDRKIEALSAAQPARTWTWPVVFAFSVSAVFVLLILAGVIMAAMGKRKDSTGVTDAIERTRHRNG